MNDMSKGFIFKLSDDGKSYGIEGYEGRPRKIRIPEEHEGLAVTEILSKAFLNSKVTSVYIPSSVKVISEGAFSDCKSLVSVEIAEGVVDIYSYAFLRCINLVEINLPDSLETLGAAAFSLCRKLKSIKIPDKVLRIGESCFRECRSLEKVEIGSGVEIIAINAFLKCENLTSVKLGERVCVIGSFSFEWCKNLESLEIPSSVTTIGCNAFTYCEKLRMKEYGKCLYLGNHENPYHAVVGYIPQREELEFHPETRVIAEGIFYRVDTPSVVRIPDKIKQIGYEAFVMCEDIETLIIGKSVEYIGMNGFAECEGIKTVVFPKSLVEIDEYAFCCCYPKEVIYEGSEEEYKKIEIGEGNSELNDARLIVKATE